MTDAPKTSTGTGIAGAMDYVPHGTATAARARCCFICSKPLGERSAHSVRAAPFSAEVCSKACSEDPRFASPPSYEELARQVEELRRGELAAQEQDDLVATVSYALRYSMEGRPLAKGMKIPDPDIAAARVVEHLARSLWSIRRRPPVTPHSAG